MFVDKGEISTPPEVTGVNNPDLNELFGDGCSVVENQTGGYEISTHLQDGIARGGQRIDLSLKKLSDIRIGGEVVQVFPCENIMINGHDVTKKMPKIMFIKRPEKSDGMVNGMEDVLGEIERLRKLQEEGKGYSLLNLNKIRTVGSMVNLVGLREVVLMATLRTADDLVTLFHETGHVINKDRINPFQKGLMKNQLRVVWAVASGKLNKETEENKNILLSAVDKYRRMEQKASKVGFKQILEMEPEVKMFQGDEGLVRVRNSFITRELMGYVKTAEAIRGKPMNTVELHNWTSLD